MKFSISTSFLLIVFLASISVAETHSIWEPIIKDLNAMKHYIVGDTITLKCSMQKYAEFSWSVPNENRVQLSEFSGKDSKYLAFFYNTLTVKNASLDDSGKYTCRVSDYQHHVNENSIYIRVYAETHSIWEPIIKNLNPMMHYIVGDTITLNCSVESHVPVEFSWVFQNDNRVQLSEFNGEDPKYQGFFNNTLNVKNTSLDDSGIYTCRVSDYQHHVNENSIYIRVYEKPTIELELEEEFPMVNENITVKCIVTSHHVTYMDLRYKPCFDDSCDYKLLGDHYAFNSDDGIMSWTTSFKKSGLIKCQATEDILHRTKNRTSQQEVRIFLSDVNGGFDVELLGGIKTRVGHLILIIPVENSVEMKCSAYKEDFTQNIKWKRDSKEIISNKKYEITTSSTDFSNSSILNISNVHMNDNGFYTCELYKITGDTEELFRMQSIAVLIPPYKVPVLIESNLNSTIEINDGSHLELKCVFKGEPKPKTTWYKDNDILTSSDTRSISQDGERVTFTSTMREDEGLYKCEAKNTWGIRHKKTRLSFKSYSILDPSIVELRAHFFYTVGDTITLKCSVESHVPVNFSWVFQHNNGVELSEFSGEDSKYHGFFHNTLTVKNTSLDNTGMYTCRVSDYLFNEKESSTYIKIYEKISIELKLEEEFQMVNENITVKCIVSSYIGTDVNLEYKPCFDDSCDYEFLTDVQSVFNRGKKIISVTNSFEKSGLIKCMLTRYNFNATKHEYFQQEVGVFLSDVNGGFAVEFLGGIETRDDHHILIVTVENSIEMKCSAYIQDFTQNIKWKRDSKEIISNKKYEITTSSTDFSISSILNISNVNRNDRGFYTCELYNISGDTEQLIRNRSIAVVMSSAPVLIESNLKSTVEINDGSYLELTCVFKGEPKPITRWYKDNDILTSSDTRSISKDGQRVTFTSIMRDDEGLYKCEANNTCGIGNKETRLSVKSNTGFKLDGIVIGVSTLLVVIASVTTIIYYFNKKKLEKILEESGLTNFEEGQLDNLNPELGIGEQVEFLPYDRSFEFPFNKLKLGKILGSGAFGVVVMGEAKGILLHEEVTLVAVKMVDRNAQQLHIKALVAELKILIYLGKHLNVVNLLGACTKKIAKRELLVIEEYCRYGNLQTYLYRRRSNFINQMNPSTGSIDFEYTECISSSNDSTWLNQSKCASSQDACITGKSTCIVTSQMSISDEEVIHGPSTEQKLEDCCEENKRRVESISTADLLSWSFQVARGMEYLVSRRVLHGDLAARNILLADDDVVKICDFGLAKRTYHIENYKKTSDGPLPVKWMAIESIRDRVFSFQSDVWSFGIVLWELFSLAKIPYPGMEADEKLFVKLDNGYRMEAPKYSNTAIYKIMLDCWSANPLNRPTFSELSERLGLLLEDSVRAHYIKLNDPYLMKNAQRIEGKENDYLTMMTPPSFQQLKSPQNDGSVTPSGYVEMSGQESPQKKVAEISYVNNKSGESTLLTENIDFTHI